MAKKKEPIVLNKTELMPTNLGSMKQKESGIIITILILVVFVVGIFFLPQIMELLNPVNNAPIPYVPSTVEPENPNPGSDENPSADLNQLYEVKEGLAIEVEGYTFNEFVVNSTPGTISFVLTNHTGSASYFQTHSYYIEYYSQSEELLGRTKLIVQNMDSSISQEYEISNVTKIGMVSKIAIKEIDENEYPAVNLRTNNDKIPYLECSNQNHVITYYFELNKNKYELKRFENRVMIANSSENYETILEQYTTLSDSMESIKGLEVSLTPIVSGFEFVLESDLRSLSESNRKTYLKEPYYYLLNTDAKVISFEMQAQNYSCK